MTAMQDEFDCSICSLTQPHTHSKVIWDDIWGLVAGPNDKIERTSE